MKELEKLKNSEVEVCFREYEGKKISITLTGNISTPLSNTLFDTNQVTYQKNVFAPPEPLDRVILDLRGLKYVNSIGAAILIRFYNQFKKSPFKLILVFGKQSEVADILETLGFFIVSKPIVVWDSFEEALNRTIVP